MIMGALLFAQSREANEKRPTGATPATSSCNCRLAGPVPLRLSALSAIGYRYPGTTTEAIARWYCAVLLREGRHSTIGMVRSYFGLFPAGIGATAAARPSVDGIGSQTLERQHR